MATKTSLCALALLSLFLSRQKLVVVSGRRALTKLVSLSLVSSRWSPLFVVVVFVFSTVRPIGCVSDVAAGVVFLFFFFFFCVGSIFFGLFVDTNEKDLVALGELERLWKRKTERKKERERETFRKKKGRNFLSLSLSREKKHLLHTFVLYNDLVFSFFFQKTCETTLMTREKKGGKKTHRVSLFFASLDTLKRKQPLCFVIL